MDIDNDKSINFWYGTWLTDYPLISKLATDNITEINPLANVSNFIDEKKNEI